MSSADDWLRQAEEQTEEALEQAADLRAAVATTKGSARSTDGLVRAVVAPGGALVSLDLDERAMSQTAMSLQQSIMDTVHRASADAATQLEHAVRPVVGDRYDEALKAASSEMPEIPGLPERAGAHGKDEDEDDLSQANLFDGGGR